MRKITILHIADIHSRSECNVDLKKRINSLICDLESMGTFPDVVVISGDLAFSGQKDEYENIGNYLIKELCKKFNIPWHNIILAMGNHDIDRTRVDKYMAQGILNELSANPSRTAVVRDSDRYKDSERNYREYLKSVVDKEDPTYSTEVAIEGLSVGFAVLNTARTCFSEDDTRNRIYLDREEVNQQLDNVQDCALKIGVMHHPISWLHESQKENIIPDLTQGVDMILTGHLHEVDSASIVKPHASYVLLAAPSFYEGSWGSPARFDGYNVYEIDPANRRCKALYRKFIPQRNKFVQNVDFADNGECEFAMPSKAFVTQPTYATYAIANRIRGALSAEMDENLKQIQKIDNPVYVSPALFSTRISPMGERVEERLRDGNEKFTTFNVMFAPADVGSTMYLKAKCQDVIDKGDVAFYIDASQISKALNRDELEVYVSSRYKISKEEVSLDGVSLFVDNIGLNAQQVISSLREIDVDAKFYLCVKNEFAFESLCRGNTNENTAFFQFKYWGPAKLREFIEKFVRATGAKIENLDAASEFIINSLAISDIPVTPFLVAVYLRVFCEYSGALGSLPVFELLEQIETRYFTAGNGAGLRSRYWSRKFLTQLAIKCYKTHSFDVDEISFVEEFKNAIELIGLDGNVESLVKRLVDSGVLLSTNGRLSFACYTYMRYYLSFSFDDGEIKLDTSLSNVEDAMAVGDAAAFYVARFRGKKEVVDGLLATVADNFAEDEKVSLEKLEEYARGLIAPIEEPAQDDPEQIVADIENRRISEEIQDQEFLEHKETARQAERESLESRSDVDAILPIAQDISLLKMTYHVFRNSEELLVEDKKLILDKILDFHLCCNMRLVKFFSGITHKVSDISSLFAYLITLGGTCFLSYNVGSWSLRRAIQLLYKETTDELRKFLLICIMIDLGMPEGTNRLVELVLETKSLALIEMGYFKFRECLIRYDKERLSKEMIASFSKIHKVRNTTARYLTYSRIATAFNDEIEKIKQLHLEYLRDKLAGREV